MRSLKMVYEDGLARVDWGAEESGIHALKSRVINHFLTRKGSDKLDTERGTELDVNLFGVGVFDAVGIQHQLNFAVVDVVRAVRESNSDDAPDDAIESFSATLTGYSSGRAAVSLQVSNVAGAIVGGTTEL